ncbi:hypothetical protein KI387_043381, partial [Taxus chinensis]
RSRDPFVALMWKHKPDTTLSSSHREFHLSSHPRLDCDLPQIVTRKNVRSKKFVFLEVM